MCLRRTQVYLNNCELGTEIVSTIFGVLWSKEAVGWLRCHFLQIPNPAAGVECGLDQNI